MFSCDGDTLVIKQVESPKELHINILDDVKESYATYLNSTVYSDMKYLIECLRDIKGLETISGDFTVGNLERREFMRTQVVRGDYYFPVIADFKLSGHSVGRRSEILRIPYMDDYGKLTVAGKTKVCMAVQRPSDDISYDMKDDALSIAMPHANISIRNTATGIKMRFGRQHIPLDRIIGGMLYEAGVTENIYNVITNGHLLDKASYTKGAVNANLYSDVSKSGILERLKSEQYALGTTRTALNEALTLDRAIGHKLARDVGRFHRGDTINPSMLSELKRSQCNLLYILANAEECTGYRYGGEQPIVLFVIPKGMPNIAWVKKKVPQYAHLPAIPEDITLTGLDRIIVAEGSSLTPDIIELLEWIGQTTLPVTVGASKKILTLSLEYEIIGNYTAKLSELVDIIPDGRSADEWVYYYNNPTLAKTDDTHLTAHDLLAIYSIMGSIYVSGKSPLLNKDTSFLKKTLLVGDLFSESLRKTISTYVATFKNSIGKNITNPEPTAVNPLINLTREWYKAMTKARFLNTVDSTNFAAEVTQVCKINTLVESSSSVSDAMRYLALPLFGRICPYETPAGKQLGLVNTKAIGAKVINGVLCTPYRKVLKTPNGIKISDKITYLSVKDELGYKFGDIMTLQKDAQGNYLNTPIIAKIPNPDISDERFIIATINAFDLAGGFVAADPEQFLSPTAALIPFACSNDTNRITFGLNQIRQAIYLQNSEIPRVRTDMYEDIFNYADHATVCSDYNGTVVTADNTHVVIQDSSGITHDILLRKKLASGTRDSLVSSLVYVGQSVSIGTPLAEIYECPKSFLVRAPYSGRITAIEKDSITIAKCRRDEPIPIDLEQQDVISFENCRILGSSPIFINLHCSVNDYVEKGQILASTPMSREGSYTPSRNPLVGMIACGYNHEDGVAISKKASIDYTSLIANTIDIQVNKNITDNRTKEKRKRNVRSKALSGFKYCEEGDVAGEILVSDNAIDSASSIKVRATLKHHGIPFEVVNIDEDANKRTYRFHLLDLKQTNKGDKMAGRHGNKGVVSMVYNNSQAPVLANGRPLEVLLNPHGVPSRMNLGQILDMHLSLAATVLGINIKTGAFNCATIEDIRYMVRYAYDVANAPGLRMPDGSYSREAFDRVKVRFSQIPEHIHELVWKNIDGVYDWRGVFDENGDAELYDPETDTWFENKITIGFPYYNKQVQEGDEKLTARSGPLEESYARITSQPQKSDTSNQGQRMAEMELIALASYGTAKVQDEVLNEKSDNMGAKTNAHIDQLKLPESYKVGPESCTPRSLANLLYFLEACGVKLELPEEIFDSGYNASISREQANLTTILQEVACDNSRMNDTTPEITLENIKNIDWD